MFFRLLPVCAVATSFLGTTASVYADPITLGYHVIVSQTTNLSFPAQPWVPIDPIIFNLSMTFDGEVTAHSVTLPEDPSDESAQFHWVTNFGPAAFSPVPLPGAEVNSGPGHTAIFNSIVGGQPDQIAGASQNVRPGGSIQLFARGLHPALAAGEFGTLDTFLRAMNSSHVEFFFAGTAVAFSGRADAVDASLSAVPEPGTMMLVGTALAASALRRRRQRWP
jgi:PEP-CTERM motif-containing protein